jgi:hypothetical protein
MEDDYYTSTIQRKGKQVYIPDTLLDVSGIEPGDYMEVKIRKLNVPNKK